VTLADRIEAILVKRPLPAGTLATELHKRKADVLAELHGNPERFVRTGRTKASRWSIRSRGFDAHEAAARWSCTPETAAEIIFGAEGFLERGFVASLNGNGRVVVTERGLEIAAIVQAAAR